MKINIQRICYVLFKLALTAVLAITIYSLARNLINGPIVSATVIAKKYTPGWTEYQGGMGSLKAVSHSDWHEVVVRAVRRSGKTEDFTMPVYPEDYRTIKVGDNWK